jgi:hypothetical protein
MRFVLILILVFIVTGIYLLPSLVATFYGSHTMETNTTPGGIENLNCRSCHEYIFEELNQTVAQDVLQRHGDAAGNKSYTWPWLQRNLSTQDYGVCLLCHAVITEYENQSHTGTVIRACTDINCHGTNQTSGTSAYPTGQVGPILGKDNVHAPWFDGMSNLTTNLINETGANYTKGFWTCLGCHTYIGVDKYVSKETFNHSYDPDEPNRYI